MARFSVVIMGTVILACGLAYCGPPETPESRLQETLNSDPVVKARTVKTLPGNYENWKGWYRQVVEITHVYCGPDELMGKAIEVVSAAPDAGGGNGPVISPPLEAGETVIVELEHSDGNNGQPAGWYVRYAFWNYFFVSRDKPDVQYIREMIECGKRGPDEREVAEKSIRDHKKDIESCVRFSAALENIWRAKPEKQWLLLKELVRSGDCPICLWAIKILDQAKPEWIGDFYDTLVLDETFPIAGQQYLDDLLCESRGEKWSHCSERHNMLKKWVTAKLSKEDAEIVVGSITHLRAIDPEWDQELTGLAEKNKSIPESLKKRLPW